MRNFYFFPLILLLGSGYFSQSTYSKMKEPKIVIIKHKFELRLYEGRNLIKVYPVAIGKNPGDKERVGDYRTPEGNFYIVSIEDSSKWKHDFGDGKGPIKGAYGPYFLRLYTGKECTRSGKGWVGFAIHGTHDESSIGKMASEGCIRMRNTDVTELKSLVKKGTPVIINP